MQVEQNIVRGAERDTRIAKVDLSGKAEREGQLVLNKSAIQRIMLLTFRVCCGTCGPGLIRHDGPVVGP